MKKFYKDYYLCKSKYQNNGRLYLCLDSEEDFWGDITINLSGLDLQDNEIALNEWASYISKDLEELGLFKVVRKEQYNMGTYDIAIINMEVINEYGIDMEVED